MVLFSRQVERLSRVACDHAQGLILETVDPTPGTTLIVAAFQAIQGSSAWASIAPPRPLVLAVGRPASVPSDPACRPARNRADSADLPAVVRSSIHSSSTCVSSCLHGLSIPACRRYRLAVASDGPVATAAQHRSPARPMRIRPLHDGNRSKKFNVFRFGDRE